MGCDIHVGVEVLREEFEGATNHQHALAKVSRGRRWKNIPPPTITLFKNADGSDYTGTYWYWGRNYRLFALLADVRNDYSITPIDMPRGLPVDMDPETEDDLSDEHSQTWFLLSELLAASDQQILVPGVVTLDEYEILRKGGPSPTSWARSIFGGGIVTISEQQANDILDGKADRDAGVDYRVDTTWTDTLADTLSEWAEFLDRIKPLSETGDFTDVRVVMDFDS